MYVFKDADADAPLLVVEDVNQCHMEIKKGRLRRDSCSASLYMLCVYLHFSICFSSIYLSIHPS